MSFYVVQENGSKILLENGTGALLLEANIPGPTINYQIGGAGYPVGRRKRRHETQALFDRIERLITNAVAGVEDVVEGAPSAAEAIGTTAARGWTPAGLEASLARLAELARGREDLETRLDQLRETIESAATDRRLIDDEETWFLML